MAETVVSSEEILSHQEAGYMGYCTHQTDRPWVVYYMCTGRTGQLQVVEGKTSVVSGVFIPGIYRVNPYSVKGGRFRVSHNGRGAFFKGEDEYTGDSQYYTVSQFIWPGIHTLHDPLIAANDPCYFVTKAFENTCYKDAGGYYVGDVYYQCAFVVGDWWRYRLASMASDEVTPHEAADYEQLALQKAHGKVATADLELGESIGEYRETIKMLRSPLSSLKKFLLDDRSRNLNLLKALAGRDWNSVARLSGRTGMASVDAAASTWLELRYGLRPLVSLIQDVIDRIDAQQREILDPDRIRSSRSKLTFPVERWVSPSYDLSGTFIRSRVKVEDVYTATASVQYKQTETQGALDLLGLTPRFLPEVAWQLTTLSFVWDWIFTIGPWLATLRINPGVEILGNTVGFKHERKVTMVATEMKLVKATTAYSIPWKPLVGVHDGARGGDLMLQTSSYDRKVDLDLSYLPHFTWGRTFDLYKVIDSISLIWQFAQNLRR